MARPRLIDRDTPIWKRLYLYPYQVLSSLALAVPLLLALAGTLALGTFVEAAYGTPTAQFFVYRAWWFNLLIALLATNIFCAAAIRFPWKRHQTGFVVTHIGLLTLIFASLISRLYGIDAQIPVFEYESSNWAVDDDYLFEIAIRDESGEASTLPPASLRFFGMNWVGMLACAVTIVGVVVGVGAAAVYSRRKNDLRYLLGSAGLSVLTLLAMVVWVSMHYAYAKQELPLAASPGTRIERVKFSPGTMNWEDYAKFSPFSDRSNWGNLVYAPPFWVSMRDRAGETLYDRDGIKLEVLDYLADSDEIVVPQLKLQLSLPSQNRQDEQGRSVAGPVMWREVELAPVPSPNESQFPVGMPTRDVAGGGALVFGLAANEAEEQGFAAALPEGELGERGQVALYVDGKTRRFQVDERLDGERIDLGDGWQARLAAYWPASRLTPTNVEAWRNGQPLVAEEDASQTGPVSPTVKVELFAPGSSPASDADAPTAELTLFAVTPNFNLQAHAEEIYGAFWFDHSTLDANERMALNVSRIEILQSHRESDAEPFELAYRYWNGSRIVASGDLPLDGSKESALDAFVMPIATLKMYVDGYRGSDLTEKTMVGRPFDREALTASTVPAAKVRLTVDDESEEFWIAAYLGFPDEEPRHASQTKFLAGGDRLVSLKMPIDMYDVGFRVYLQEFERRLDPGTSQPSHYSSTVTFLDRDVKRGLFTVPMKGGEPTFRKLAGVEALSDLEYAGDGSLVWCEASTGRIGRVDAATGEIEPLLSDATRRPEYLTLADGGERILWIENRPTADGMQGAIYSATLDELRSTIAKKGVLTPTKVYEQAGRLGDLASYEDAVYFVNPEVDAIGKAPLDGSTGNPIWMFVAGPRDVAIDSVSGQIFWIAASDGSLRRRVIEGGEKSNVTVSDENFRPIALAMDEAGRRVVWTEEDRSPRKLVEAESRKWTPLRSSISSFPIEGDAEEPRILADRGIDDPGQIAVAPPASDEGLGEVAWIQRPSSRQDVWITMNAPVEMTDPVHGRSFRVFQESFAGPFKPGEREFDLHVPPEVARPQLFRSVLTVNHDPGRGIRNLGTLMIVLGIVLMFYMRAYFFKPKPRPTDASETRTSRAQRAVADEAAANDREPVSV